MSTATKYDPSTSGLADFFLKIEGIEGESKDKDYKGWIQLQGWKWSQENGARWSKGSGGGAGKINMNDIEFRMLSNKATPKIFNYCANGKHISEVKLVCRKAGSGQQDFLTMTFSNCLISSYDIAGNMPHNVNEVANTNSVMPGEIMKLNFSKIEIQYREQNDDGTMGAAVTTHYDLATNRYS
ncbi:Hcp family type VI secretion system effector [Cedecea sp.]|jgi:type VI secretion system secreted protein Hcp|uniref:Hcp family type VI secretion system effector n=1 Tax=Cedecea sp. TaxID=1970739 RepID=UPI0012AD7B9E|nr:type VI secretion system tube protein Hcp [Enterobacteriaceae bacterium RIT693]